MKVWPPNMVTLSPYVLQNNSIGNLQKNPHLHPKFLLPSPINVRFVSEKFLYSSALSGSMVPQTPPVYITTAFTEVKTMSHKNILVQKKFLDVEFNTKKPSYWIVNTNAPMPKDYGKHF